MEGCGAISPWQNHLWCSTRACQKTVLPTTNVEPLLVDPLKSLAWKASPVRLGGTHGGPGTLITTGVPGGCQAEGPRRPAAIAEAEAWQAAAEAWAHGLQKAFPLYLDLVQPLVLATLEVRLGLSLLMGCARTAVPPVERALASLLAFPLPDALTRTLSHVPSERAAAAAAEGAVGSTPAALHVDALAGSAGQAAIGAAAAAAAAASVASFDGRSLVGHDGHPFSSLSPCRVKLLVTRLCREGKGAALPTWRT